MSRATTSPPYTSTIARTLLQEPDAPPPYSDSAVSSPEFPVTLLLKHCHLILATPTSIQKFRTIASCTSATLLNPSLSLAELQDLCLRHFLQQHALALPNSDPGHDVKMIVEVPCGDAGMVAMTERNCRALLRIAQDYQVKKGKAMGLEVRFGCVCIECLEVARKAGGMRERVGRALDVVLGRMGRAVERLRGVN